MIVLDACVLAAFADPSHTHHANAKAIMARTEPFAMSALTGTEVMVPNPHQAPHTTYWADLFAAFGIRVISLTEADMSALAALRAASGVRMPDAVVLHTALTCSASLATFDTALAKVAATRGVAIVEG